MRVIWAPRLLLAQAACRTAHSPHWPWGWFWLLEASLTPRLVWAACPNLTCATHPETEWLIWARCPSLTQTACPEVDWHCFPGSGFQPQCTQKEQGEGTPHTSPCNWWIKDTGLVQMDTGGLEAHVGHGLEAGQLWILKSRTIGREKSKAQAPYSYGTWEDQQNSLNRSEVSSRLIFVFPLSFFPPFFFFTQVRQ